MATPGQRVRAALVTGLLVATSCSASDELSLDRSPGGTVEDRSAPDDVASGEAGSAGVGDPYFPGLGNGGYDVESYDIDLDWQAATGSIEATTTIDLTATEDLSSLNLDLHGLDVGQVIVDGEASRFSRDGRELTIELPAPLGTGTATRIVVDYAGRPVPIRLGTDVFRVGWHTDGPDAYVVSEPAGAATWFPSNDHPTDKATFRFEVTVDEGTEVIANGLLRSSETVDGRTTWVYESSDLMATYLASVVIGDLAFDESVTPSGVVVRNAAPVRLAEEAERDFAATGEMLTVFEDWFGPYPFEVYGHVVVDEDLGFALENQTLSLFGSDLVTGAGAIDRFVAHELAHQWVGNAVSPASWRDIWLNEGFATYAEWIWEQESGGATIAESARATHPRADFGVPPGEPGPAELFHPTVYLRGGLVLHALSVEIGEDAFRSLLREWFARHDDTAASTDDLLALAEEVSGQELDGLFDAWVYGEELPGLP